MLLEFESKIAYDATEVGGGFRFGVVAGSLSVSVQFHS
jgi:hypothetical protein